MESGTACFVSVGPAESEGKQAKEASQGAETRSADGQEEQEVDLLPVQAATLVAAADMYAMEPKPASVAGGLLTVLAVLAAVAYTVYQLISYSHTPPTLTADVQWADTQGPFPATIRCTAPGGCWVSNRHNDQWSSNGDQVEAAQQGCLLLAPGHEHVMNVTFTQNVRNGLVVVWDPSQWDPSTTPGSGFQILAETNHPAAPSGILVLSTPVLGGTYLASYIETHNNSAHVAKLRREWFITYVSSDKSVVPAATACAAQLSAAQLANYTQATIRIQSAWYKVSIDPPDLWLTLVGNCGGALQLFLQGGAILLLTWEFMREKLTGAWARYCCCCWAGSKVHDRRAPDAPSTHGKAAAAPQAGGRPTKLRLSADCGKAYSLTGQVFVDGNTGRHFALLSPGANNRDASHAGLHLPGAAAAGAAQATSPHSGQSAMMRGLAALSMSGDGSMGTALRGLPIGGHRAPAGDHQHSRLQQQHGVLFLSSSGGAA